MTQKELTPPQISALLIAYNNDGRAYYDYGYSYGISTFHELQELGLLDDPYNPYFGSKLWGLTDAGFEIARKLFAALSVLRGAIAIKEALKLPIPDNTYRFLGQVQFPDSFD